MILRSFAVRGVGGTMPREGNFTARVSEFLGVAARPDGFTILTLCDEPAKPMGLLLLSTVPQPGASRWDFFVRVDGEEMPPGRQVRKSGTQETGIMAPRFLGAAALGDGVAFVFVTPHDAPQGMEFVQ